MENYLKNDPNFESIITVFNKNNIPYWICHGTLLGVIRDEKLIDWDHDIDLGVWSTKVNREEVINIITKEGFKLREEYGIKSDTISFTKHGGRIVDINFYNVLKEKNSEDIAYVKWYIPKNIFMQLVDALSQADTYMGKYRKLINSASWFKNFFKLVKNFLIKIKLFYKITGYSEPVNLIGTPKIIYFKDLEVKIPINPEKYLRYIYGEEWKVPKKNYIWYKESKSLI